MIIFYGHRSRVTWTGEEPANTSCTQCGQRALVPVVSQGYFHVFWIPMFPLWKKANFVCGQCRRIVDAKEQPALKEFARDAKREARTPFWYFLGAAAIALLIGTIAVEARERSANEAEWIKAPATGDYYVIETKKLLEDVKPEPFKYVVARVVDADSDSVDLRVGTYSYEMHSTAREAIDDNQVANKDYFMEDTATVPLTELTAWQADGSLHDIIRK